MVNYSNNSYNIITDKRSIPFNSALTGTISTDGAAVIGVGTLFKTQLPVNSYLLNLPQWEFRKVIRMDSDTRAYLDQPFSVNIPALSVGQAIHYDKANPKEISIEVSSSLSPALVNNTSFTGILTMSKQTDRSSSNDTVHPFIVDASGTEMRVFILY